MRRLIRWKGPFIRHQFESISWLPPFYTPAIRLCSSPVTNCLQREASVVTHFPLHQQLSSRPIRHKARDLYFPWAPCASNGGKGKRRTRAARGGNRGDRLKLTLTSPMWRRRQRRPRVIFSEVQSHFDLLLDSLQLNTHRRRPCNPRWMWSAQLRRRRTPVFTLWKCVTHLGFFFHREESKREVRKGGKEGGSLGFILRCCVCLLCFVIVSSLCILPKYTDRGGGVKQGRRCAPSLGHFFIYSEHHIVKVLKKREGK